MRDQCAEQRIYAQNAGLSTAEVYRDNGVYYVFLVGDQVACFLGKSTSLEDCRASQRSVLQAASANGGSWRRNGVLFSLIVGNDLIS